MPKMISKLFSLLSWILRALLFFLFVLFAIKNMEPVTLRLWFGQVWEAPLVAVLGVFLFIGVGLGIVAFLGRWVRLRREITQLKRELRLRTQERAAEPEAPPLDAA